VGGGGIIIFSFVNVVIFWKLNVRASSERPLSLSSESGTLSARLP
jgi:hypothetical protein